jgi:two-component system, OmpR family, response regulator
MRLGSHGFEVRRCIDMFHLYQSIRQYSSPDGLIMVLLDGSFGDNCAGAAGLRAQYPDIGIVALVVSPSQDQWAQVLQSGADSYCPKNASDRLLSATVFRLLSRMGRTDQSQATRHDLPAHGGWSLDEQAWVVVDPTGVRVALTTGERAFLLTLFNAADLRAEHAKLIAAVDACSETASHATSRVRLGVLVSRLRQKFRRRGINLPLKSVHRWGYMFAR